MTGKRSPSVEANKPLFASPLTPSLLRQKHFMHLGPEAGPLLCVISAQQRPLLQDLCLGCGFLRSQVTTSARLLSLVPIQNLLYWFVSKGSTVVQGISGMISEAFCHVICLSDIPLMLVPSLKYGIFPPKSPVTGGMGLAQSPK